MKPVAAAPAPPTQERALDGALVRGMGVVAVFVALASVVRLGQDAAIAWRFGTSPAVDAYYFLFSLASWPIAVALSLLSVVVAPADAQLRSSDPAAAERFRGEMLGSVLLLAAAAFPLAWWALRAVAGSPLGGLQGAAATQAGAGAPALAAMVPMGLLGALLSAWLIASGRHVLALLEGLPAFVLLGLLLAAPGTVLFWGTSVGYAIQAGAMLYVLHRAGHLPVPRLGWSSRHWQGFSQGALLLLASQVLFTFFPLIDAFFAARLGEGAVASVSYTNRLVLGLQGLAGLALQRSGLPLLSALSLHSPGATRRAALRWSAAMGGVGVVGGLLVALLADPLVALLFERGSFTAADRAQCASLLRYGMLQMPPFLASMALVTALAAAHARRALALISIGQIAVKLLASAALVAWLGAPGLMVATACMYAVAAVAGWAVLRGQPQASEA